MKLERIEVKMSEMNTQENESVEENTELNEQEAEIELSLQEELAKNFKESIANATEEEQEDQKEIEDDKTEKDSSEETEEAEIDDSVDINVVIKPPSGWNKKEREQFEALDDNAKEILTKYDKSRTADYTRKTQEVAEQRKDLESLVDVTEPYKDDFKRMGVKPAEYLSKLLNIDVQLNKDPAGTIRYLADIYKVNGTDLGFTGEPESNNFDSDDDYLTDSEIKLKQQIKELKQEAAENRKRVDNVEKVNSEEKEQIAVRKTLDDFASQKDDDGNILRPHFDDTDVQGEMSILCSSGKTLEEAYKASPTAIRLAYEKGQEETPKQKTIRNKQQIAKVKKAGRRVSSSSADTVSYEGMSLNDELKARYREQISAGSNV